MNAHLRRCVDLHIRQNFADRTDCTEILHDAGIHERADRLQIALEIRQFRVGHEGIHREVKLHAVQPAKT